MKSAVYLLPFPTSVNGLYAGKSRRYKSRAYKDWITEAGWALNQQHKHHFGGPVEVTIRLGRPDNRRRDAFNYEKAPIDLLVSHHILMDDSLIEWGHIGWDKEIVGCQVEVEAL